MKIDLFDMDEFAELNLLKEVTSPIVFQRGAVPDPYGLLSTDIFGISVKSRRDTFAYVNLHGKFFHPHVYKSFKRLFRNIEKIINGELYYRIDEKGVLVRDDENGETGIDFIYKNWEKIKWEKNTEEGSIRNERIDLLTKTPKNQVFIDKMLIIPVFYRDIIPSTTSKGGETDPLNNCYQKLIRLSKLLIDKDMFDFTLHSTVFNMQSQLVELYDIFKHKLEKKNGMIRKYLMGKNVDNCVRSVISCPLYHSNSPEDQLTSFGNIGVPISQICATASPFLIEWLKRFFDREFVQTQYAKVIVRSRPNEDLKVEQVSLYKPELFFSDKYITNMLERYMHDPEYRFDPIKVPISKDEFVSVAFSGKKMDPSGTHELSTISERPMTVTDLLYIACEDVIKPLHALITRYPVSDAYGLFVAKPVCVSTLQTEVVRINDRVYKHYPKIDLAIPRSRIAIRFIDTLQFSNSYLAGLGGDYDGDQVTLKLLWSQEANAECERIMNSKSFFISPDGSNVRPIKYEVYQTFYDMTREPFITSRKITNDEKKELLNKDPAEFSFTYLSSLFADTMENGKKKKSRFETNDIVTLNVGEYCHNTKPITTTVGRIVWNKIMIDRVGLRAYFPYNNGVLTKKEAVKYEQAVTNLLHDDKIDSAQFRRYIDHRDWLGLILHSLITVSLTEKTVKTPESVKKLRDELFKKYEKELKDGDIVTANKVEKILIDAMVDYIKDDPGYDLYASGARGDINNHLKNLFVMRGGVLNPNTGKYDIMKSSYNEGIRKEDFTPSSNNCAVGAYAKSCSTADSGYLAKQLMAGDQTEVIGPDGSDCGTERTLDFVLPKAIANKFIDRYIKVNGKQTLLTSENIDKFIDKPIHLYSPLFCCGKQICEKCAGKQTSKFVGLDTNKVATVLTNLNMKKFHVTNLSFSKVDPNDLLINHSSNAFSTTDLDIIVEDNYFEMYVPDYYFENGFMAKQHWSYKTSLIAGKFYHMIDIKLCA